jgi:hypothetical protein
MVVAAGLGGWRTASAQATLMFRLSEKPEAVQPVHSNFLGVALEYRSVPGWVGTPTVSQPVNPVLVGLIRSLAPGGQPVVRIGGQSTDRTWWPGAGIPQPPGITYDLTSGWLAQTRALAQAADAKLILGLGLEADQPDIDAIEAQHLVSGITTRWIDALEIGNEPELYTLIPWYRLLGKRPLAWYSSAGTPVFSRGVGWGPAEFSGQFSRVMAVLPQLPIAGPATGSMNMLNAFEAFLAPKSRARIVTWHSYGLNACVSSPTSPSYATVPNLLTPFASRAGIAGIGPAVAKAHRYGAQFLVDEMGSVTCNGKAGVSNTFASALWVMDSLFAMAADGVDGASLHTYPGSANGLFDFTHGGGVWRGTVHPLYYGALMFSQAAPAGSRLLPITSPDPGAVRAWATHGIDGRTRILLINDGMRYTAHIEIGGLTGGPAGTVERLVAPSPYATSGVSLGGRSFAAGTTSGVLRAPVLQSIKSSSNLYAVSVAPATAVLITLPAAPTPAGTTTTTPTTTSTTGGSAPSRVPSGG